MHENHLRALIGKLNDCCRQSLESAIGICVTQTHHVIDLEHLLVALGNIPNTDFQHILDHFAVDRGRLAKDLTRVIDRFQKGNTRSPVFSDRTLDALQRAWLLASLDYGAPQIRSGHMLLALLEHGETARLLRESSAEWKKVSVEALQKGLTEASAGSAEVPSSVELPDNVREGEHAVAEDSALARFTTDLTEQARLGKLDPVLGRDEEIRRTIAILLRRRQNNPILVGDAGVGKTAIVEGLALRIGKDKDVPAPLKDVCLRVLDLGLLQAGAGVRGEFENRLKSVLEEVKAAPRPTILFIDEAHTLIGAGAQAGQSDAANLLKPAMARGELRTIAATTWAEYKQYFETDAALTRRFQLVKVAEPTQDKAEQMLRGLVQSFERHHKLQITPDAIQAAVRLSHRYIADRYLPDKAVSVLSTACAQVELSQQSMPAALDDCHRRLAAIAAETELLQREPPSSEGVAERQAELNKEKDLVSAQAKELDARWQKELSLVAKLREASASEVESLRAELGTLQGDAPLVHERVSQQPVAEVISSWTGIPIGKMVRNEIQTLLSLPELLRRRVVGQDHALATISQRIWTRRSELSDPNRPAGVFLLVGPSGVGKTETALALAEMLFGGEQNVVTVNMSELNEGHGGAGLKGAPPGYVGYGKGGFLTEAVRRKPYCVVLLDEFEKAHQNVKQLFLRLFEKGILTDGEGREISFRNTIILLTSNIGTQKIAKLCADPETRPAPQPLLEAVRGELIHGLGDVLYGRLVAIPYYPLTDETLEQIVKLNLGRVADRLAAHHHAQLQYEQNLVKELVSRCKVNEIGARVVEQVLHQTLLPGLSRELLSRIASGQKVTSARISLSPDRSFQFTVE